MFFKNKILKTIYSPINGKIEVIKSLAFGTYISIGGLTQSGGIVYEIWKKTLGRIKKQKPDVKNCLILGLGGGSVSKIIKKYYPNAKITGVEIDKNMIKLGEKYLELRDIKSIVDDAYSFSQKELRTKNKYNLIIVDLYLGDKFPEKFETNEFLETIKRLLFREGMVIFNRLYYDKKRKEAILFANRLQKIYNNVEYFYPEANLMLICK